MSLKKNLLKSKQAQVWVETAIYTLIGISVMAIILTMAISQIDKMKDKAIIEQTISAFNTLNDKILEVEQAPGNVRVVEFRITKGKLEIDAGKDLIKYTLEDTKLEFSETGEEVKQGDIILKTEKKAANFDITLTMRYDLNITNKGGEGIKTLSAGATPYKIVIESKEPEEVDGKTIIEFSVI